MDNHRSPEDPKERQDPTTQGKCATEDQKDKQQGGQRQEISADEDPNEAQRRWTAKHWTAVVPSALPVVRSDHTKRDHGDPAQIHTQQNPDDSDGPINQKMGPLQVLTNFYFCAVSIFSV